MIEPVSEAFTISVSPARRAMKAMISSAALPKVAFRSPPMPGPVWWVRCSVASPMSPARGRMARQAATKTQTGAAWVRPSQMLIGTNTRRTRRMFFPVSRALLGSRARPTAGSRRTRSSRPGQRGRSRRASRSARTTSNSWRSPSGIGSAGGRLDPQGVDEAAVPHHPIVEVGPGGEAGHADAPRSRSPGATRWPAPHVDAREVAVEGLEAVRVAQLHGLAVAVLPPGQGHDAVGRRPCTGVPMGAA